jgi:predicted kinase
MPTYVIVTGLPASGKTTLAIALSGERGFEHLDKDTFLEELLDREKNLTPERRGELSRLADAKFCEHAGSLGFAVLSSWWKHPLSSQNSGTDVAWLRREGTQVVEIYCNCPVAIAAERFVSRRRHPGHFDSLRTKHELLRQFSETERLGPVFPQQALLCNTERELSTSTVAELGRVNTILTSAAVRVSMQR